MNKPFERVAVVGTGTLGAQIAMLASNAGYPVKIFDRQPGAFEAMMDKLRADIEAKQVEPFIPFERWPMCKQQIQQVEALGDAVADADLVIEAVPENIELKCEVFRQLGQLASAECRTGYQ